MHRSVHERVLNKSSENDRPDFQAADGHIRPPTSMIAKQIENLAFSFTVSECGGEAGEFIGLLLQW